MESLPIDRTASAKPQAAGLRSFTSLLLILAPLVLLASGLWCLRIFYGDHTAPLTRELFSRAEERWKMFDPPSYQVMVRVAKARPEVFTVKVVDHQPIEATLNGQPLADVRSFHTWTVPGMFNSMELDLEHAEQWQNGTAQSQTPRLRLWAKFDDATGLPRRYRRLEWNKGLDLTWEIEEFSIEESKVLAPKR